MAINWTKYLSVARAVLDVAGAAAIVAIGYFVYSRVRPNSNGDSGGTVSPGSVVKDNQVAIDGLNKALDALRAARNRSGS
jgi:hypothetical protein